MKNNNLRNFNYNEDYKGPPPDKSSLGMAIFPSQVSKHGNRLFNFLKYATNGLKEYEDSRVTNSKDIIHNQSDLFNDVGYEIERRLNNITKKDLDVYDDSEAMLSSMRRENDKNTVKISLDYINNDDWYVPKTIKSEQRIEKFNNINNETNKTMSNSDISEYLGGLKSSNNDNAFYVKFDNNHQAIITNTEKVCKLLGVVINLLNDNKNAILNLPSSLAESVASLNVDTQLETNEEYTNRTGLNAITGEPIGN